MMHTRYAGCNKKQGAARINSERYESLTDGNSG